MKMNPTALKQNPSTFLGSRVLISPMLWLKDTEFLRDAEDDRDHSWKQSVCTYSPESQAQLSCRAAGRDNVASLFVHCGIFWGAMLLIPRMKYTENNLLTCCNSDAFRFEILSDQSSLLWNSLIKNKSAVFIKCPNLPLWLEEHTREGFVEM